MHILWVTQLHFDSQLSCTSRLEMSQSLTRLGHRVQLVAALARRGNKQAYQKRVGVSLIPIINKPILSAVTFQLRLIPYLVAYFLTKGLPDIIVVDNRTFWLFIPIAGISRFGLCRTRIVLDIRSVPVEQSGLKARIEETTYGLSILCTKYILDGLTVITPTLREEICNKFGLRPERVGIWSSGVSLDLFNPRLLKPLPHDFLRNSRFVVMYHGVLTPNRGLQQTINAIARLRDRCPVLLFLLGEGPAQAELEALVREHKLKANVLLHPTVPYEEVPRYIACCDVAIIPLPKLNWWTVSSPLKLMEYLAMEKPVIATDIDAHRSVMGTAECVRYISNNCPEEIAQAIWDLYQQRDRLYEKGKAGRKIVKDRFTWEAQARNLEAYLYKVIDGRGLCN